MVFNINTNINKNETISILILDSLIVISFNIDKDTYKTDTRHETLTKCNTRILKTN